jgi:hypothetical protein
VRLEVAVAVPGVDAAFAAEALELLEWPCLAGYLASFASTA